MVYTDKRRRKNGAKIDPSARKFASKAEEHIKGMVAPGTLFEEFGFNYVGPMDGHNVKEIIRTLRNLNDTSGPKLLHLITKKGKGFKPAEVDPIGFHAITKMENPNASKKKNVRYEIFRCFWFLANFKSKC